MAIYQKYLSISFMIQRTVTFSWSKENTVCDFSRECMHWDDSVLYVFKIAMG